MQQILLSLFARYYLKQFRTRIQSENIKFASFFLTRPSRVPRIALTLAN
jgi:hypothetical protein